VSTLDEKKAEIDNLLNEFSWHSSRVTEIACQASRIIESLRKDHGAAALSIVVDSYARLQRIAAGSEVRPSAPEV
jgi:adenylate cyclase